MGTASKDSFRFPVGKNRLEPLGVMLFAVVMGISMLMLAREAVTDMIMGFTSDDGEGGVPTFGPEVLAGIVATVVIKSSTSRLLQACCRENEFQCGGDVCGGSS